MNYTIIIILIVLLFVIYQMRTQEKKETFRGSRAINGVNPTCPNDYKLENYNTKCYKTSDPNVKVDPTCTTGKSLVLNSDPNNYSYCCPSDKKSLMKNIINGKWMCT